MTGTLGDQFRHDALNKALGYLLDESDDIEGTRLNLGDEQPRLWVHTTEQVCDWLRDRLPGALAHAMSLPVESFRPERGAE